MSLRAKVLLLFGAFAVIPLLAIGIIDYVRSVRAVDVLVRDQTLLIAERAAREIGERYEAVNANLSVVAENVETKKLLVGEGHGSTEEREASEYFRDVWKAIGNDFQWIAIRDSARREIYRLGEPASGENDPEALRSVVRIEIPAYNPSGLSAGTVAAAIKLAPLLPADAMASHFGRSGYTALIDRATGRAMYGVGHDEVIVEALRNARGTTGISFREADSTRSASFVALAAPAWTVVSVASLDEFTAPFASIRSANLFFVLTTTVVAAIAFLVLLWRATHSLRILTLAADDVGRGHMDPALPTASRDEVGRLASAFNLMVGRVRETMAEIEHRRQMAVVGEFAAQLAHEIRNPLTSIKLNMQKLDRWSRDGRIPGETRQPLEITLREIDRLDRVVHGVLQLGRAPTSNRAATSLKRLASDAVEIARPQLERRAVALTMSATNEREPVVWGDASLIGAAILNLILNAGDASPTGGTVRVEVERNGTLAHLRVRDSGPGVPADQRDRVFEPFFTTKEGGTGLGLALAQRTVEEHGGAIYIADAAPGAIFVIDLPLMPVDA